MVLSRLGGKCERALIEEVFWGMGPEGILVSDVNHMTNLPQVQAL
jgi:hypothetical protein